MMPDWSDEREKRELEKRQRERERRYLIYMQRRHKSEAEKK